MLCLPYVALPQELAAACNAQPRCQAVVFSPAGGAEARNGASGGAGTLKGAQAAPGDPLDLSGAQWNPTTVLLIKQSALVAHVPHMTRPASAALRDLGLLPPSSAPAEAEPHAFGQDDPLVGWARLMVKDGELRSYGPAGMYRRRGGC